MFSDGDCIPWAGFLATHAELRAPGCSSPAATSSCRGRPPSVSPSTTSPQGATRTSTGFTGTGLSRAGGRVASPRTGALARALDLLTPTRASWNGHNASGWKDDLLAVNGFDERMGYGGEDRELGERLVILGRRGRQIRHRAICVHQWHERGYVSEEVLRENRRIRRETARAGVARTPFGIVKTGGGVSAPGTRLRSIPGTIRSAFS